MRFNAFFAALSVTTAAAFATPHKRDVTTLKSDIAAISTQTKTLGDSIAKFDPSGSTSTTLEDALVQHLFVLFVFLSSLTKFSGYP